MIEYNYRGLQLTDQGTAAGLSIPKLGKSFCLIADQLPSRALGMSENLGGQGLLIQKVLPFLSQN